MNCPVAKAAGLFFMRGPCTPLPLRDASRHSNPLRMAAWRCT